MHDYDILFGFVAMMLIGILLAVILIAIVARIIVLAMRPDGRDLFKLTGCFAVIWFLVTFIALGLMFG